MIEAADQPPPGWRSRRLRDIGLVAVALGGLLLYALWAQTLTWLALACLVLGTLLGVWLGRQSEPVKPGRDTGAAGVVAQDIHTLRQAFGVLTQQVDATIHTSETAVMSMIERMNRVHRHVHALREHVSQAVQRSQALSAESLQRARQHGQALALLAEHQRQLQAGQADGAARSLAEIAQHIQRLGDTLGDVVPYLGELSGQMEASVSVVTEDIINTLGDMQFQDINRQLLEQINGALASLSEHFAQIYALIDGQAPPPPVLLEELLARWNDHYVMHSQRVAHARGMGAVPLAAATGAPEDPTPLTLAPANGPRIELF